MAEAADRIGQSFDVLQGIKSKLETAKAEGMTTWSGDAANTFGRVIDGFSEKIKAQLDTLNGLREKLGAAKLSYEATEADEQAAQSKIEGLLNSI